MVMPAIHLSRTQVADTFTKETGKHQTEDITSLVRVARRELRRKFAEADMGISGMNFAVAESGAIGLVTNEGNARMVTTLPRVHVAVGGIDKLIPSFDDAMATLRVLPRNATGQHLTSYVTWIAGGVPTASAPDGKKSMHVVFVDNGRKAVLNDPILSQALRCVRCGACANVCPVYRLVGGHRMGYIYIGAIGLILTYLFHGKDRAKALVQNCVNCQACKSVCAAGIDLPGLMEHIKGPDFPTAGIIMGRSGIRAAYATGRGKITLRGRATIEETKNGRTQIIITEIPYMVNKARLIENMADLVKDKRIEGITGLNDETNRKGMRIVVDIRKDANAQVILNQLYQYTQLQDTVGVIMLAIDHKVPKVMTLKQMIQKYVEFQDEVVRRRTQYDLKKAKERAHILEGLKKATDIVDELIATIRACKGGMAEAKAAIMEQFGFDDPQADAIVKLQLGRLAGLEILKIEEELSGLQAKIKDWEDILANDARVLEIVKNELLDMKKRFGDERRTEIQSVTGEVDIEDLIAEEQCVYTLTEAGYIKRQLKATYQAQRRGGRGISGMTRKEEDIVQEMFVGSTHDYVLFVTDRGRLFRIKGYTIAEGSRTSKGSNIVNLLQLAEGEKVTNMICQSKEADTEGGFVTMVTKQGLIKRTPLEQYANIRKTGLIGIALNEGDALAWTRLTTGHDMLIVATRNGQAIRFNEADARPMGRSGHGVRAIRLAEGDEVVGVCICREGGTVLTVTENGKGRRSDIDTYRITARGGKGIRNYDAAKDKVAAVKIVDDVDDVLLSSQEGIIIRLHANEIPVQSRYGSGVRVMRLGENDKVMVLARTDHDDEAQTESIEADTEDEPTAEQLAEMEAADEASAAEAPEADTGDEE